MSRSFRFVPPDPRSDLLTRPRLLRSLAERWRHRVTSLTGGPGLGKTTLLAQAIAENRLAPQGQDVWIGLEAYDADADRLSRVVAGAITGRDGHLDDDQPPVAPTTVADAVWRLAPTEACLVLDDVHVLPAGSAGADWLAALLQAMPANGHVVLASRSEPPVPLSRFGAQGAVLRLAEDDLRFSEEELTGFAERRGLDPTQFETTGGWPAMAALAASVEGRFTGDYLWEEVLEPLGAMRRLVLAVLSDIGGGDDELASAAVGTPVDVAQALDGVPLVTRNGNGWHSPHSMWRQAPGIALDPRERAAIRRRAARHLTERGRFDEAFRLVQDAELWDVAPTVLRAACLSTDRVAASQLGRWLASSSEGVRASTPGRLAAALHRSFTAPDQATDLLLGAAKLCRADGDIDAEMTALAEVGQLSWFSEDYRVMSELMPRVFELEASGNSRAVGGAALARAVLADFAGDDDAMFAEFATLDVGDLDRKWAMVAGFVEGLLRLDAGEAEAANEVVERIQPLAEANVRYIVDALQLRAWFALGRVDEVCRRIPKALEESRRAGVNYIHYYGAVQATVAHSMVGDVATARRTLDDAVGVAPAAAFGDESAHTSVARAALRLAEGDEAEATRILEAAREGYGFDRGPYRHSWRQILPLTYVVLPDTRDYWHQQPLRGHLAAARELAAAVVAWRDGSDVSVLRTLRLPDLGVVRGALCFNLAAELAVGLHGVGRAEGRALLDALGPPGRTAVRDIVATRPQQAKAAKALLAAVPAPPPEPTYLAVLGPVALRRGGPDGEEVVDPTLRRARVQTLLAFLVGHRRTTRPAIAAALWPDLDDRSAANNLAVTLNHVLRLLEPARDSGEPAFLLRVEGQTVQLVTGEHLRIDVDDFDQHLADAARSEADGTPSVALDHYLAAAALYRDDLHADLPEAGWFVLERELYRTRFVTAAVRAGQLLLARGDVDAARDIAHRAITVDQWSEGAYAVLVGCALAQDDRSAARRFLQHCLAALTELGVSPSDATLHLQRRVAAPAG